MASETLQTAAEISALEDRIAELRSKVAELRRQAGAEPLPDARLLGRGGEDLRLSDLFRGRDQLLLVHNMGQRCAYCTLWADGFVGLWPHLNDRCAFALVSEDEPLALDAFARSRHWPFPVASSHGTGFAAALGVETSPGHTKPGVSALARRPDGTIVRTAFTEFGPGDLYCPLWHLFHLLEGGAKGWEPKLRYRTSGDCGPDCGCRA
jgi:predicted dithiol-disulfide oxidoreductase (DUF899 family)